MPNIGPLEIIIVLVIVLLIFGPKRLPELGRSLGSSMREFKDSVTGKDKEREARAREIEQRAQAEQPPVAGAETVAQPPEDRATTTGAKAGDPS